MGGGRRGAKLGEAKGNTEVDENTAALWGPSNECFGRWKEVCFDCNRIVYLRDMKGGEFWIEISRDD